MDNEKCCCNCLHCARWQTSKGIQCHCDLTDRYLGYLEVMDTNNDCCRWEKETKWDIEKEHDKKVRNKAIDDFENKILSNCASMIKDGDRVIVIRMDIFKFILEQLKAGGKNENSL